MYKRQLAALASQGGQTLRSDGLLAGEQTLDEISLNPLGWYAEHGITLHLGKTIGQIDRVRRRVIATDGTAADYDRLLIATWRLYTSRCV